MAAGITVTRSRTAILTRRQLTGPVSRSYGTHSSGLSLLSSYNASRYNRQYSTSLPPTDKGKAASTIPEPPLPVQQQKSRKVELRPGPVKPHITGGTVSVKASTPKANNASTELAKKEAAPSTTSESVTAEEGIISSAKHDLEEAAQHGILAPPPPHAGTIHKLYHQAKELFKFYYRGLKLINTNRKRANEMRERVKQGGPQLTRWEHRFIKTAEEDMRKLVPFALIILIAEEVIPLVVMYAPFILPSTCILPAQKERIDSKRRAKQHAFAASQREVFARIHALGGSSAGKDVKHLLDGPGLVAMSGILGHSNYSLNVLRARNIRKHLTSVVEDDALLLREGRGSRLTPTEVVDALSERGIVADGLSTQQQQSRLQWWLNEVHKLSTSSDKSSHDPIASRVVLIAQGAIGRQ